MPSPKEYVNNFYPPLFRDSGCREVENILYLNNIIFERFIKKIEKRLQEWTLTDGVDTVYSQKVLHYISTIYRQNVFPFMMSKKTPLTTKRLQERMYSLLQLQPGTLTIRDDMDKKTLYVTYDSNRDRERFDYFQNLIPFLYSYLPYCAPPNYTIKIDNKFALTIRDLTERVQNYNTFTIYQLSIKEEDQL